MRMSRIATLVLMLIPSISLAQIEISGDITYTNTPPVIDGIAEEEVWNAANEQADFEVATGVVDGPDDLLAIWKGLWDDDNVYFHVTVIDDAIVVTDPPGTWQDDSVEFYFDTQLHGLTADALGEDVLDYTAAPANENPIYQLTIIADDTDLHEGINHARYIENAGPGSEELNAAWILDGAVYSLEIAFPWEGLASDPDEILGQDGTMAFGVAINDQDTQDRDGQLMWATTSPELWHDATEFPFVELLPRGPDGPECDFDANSVCDIDDLNGLQGALGSNNATYDLDGSGTVDEADTDSWLTIAGNENIGTPYVRGDTDLNGQVNAGDLNSLGGNWQRDDSPRWDEGNFNGDQFVNASDLNDLGGNWLHGTAPAAAVPEPGGLCLVLLSTFTLAGIWRRVA